MPSTQIKHDVYRQLLEIARLSKLQPTAMVGELITQKHKELTDKKK